MNQEDLFECQAHKEQKENRLYTKEAHAKWQAEQNKKHDFAALLKTYDLKGVLPFVIAFKFEIDSRDAFLAMDVDACFDETFIGWDTASVKRAQKMMSTEAVYSSV
ncbi:hypothetical protein [Sansalvadorimonas verongulae]|uniref:hypothetical protein n=1 Tax=Sansalvadorimonas verongulae TaxID=2172824 RepID=UPI0012BC4CC4|nr:hypothetical protein [Sansalvadorimonas verongulae]MTI13820.1 hypothetical protein [Sansalvadorimonas verongulae]